MIFTQSECLDLLPFIFHACFPLRISSVNVTKSAGNCGLVTFTEEILNGKLHFLGSDLMD